MGRKNRRQGARSAGGGRKGRTTRSGTSRGGGGGLPAFGSAFQSTQTQSGPAGWTNVDFHVRTISGGQSTKWYRCPGCDQEIPPGIAHIVAWPVNYGGGADDRRHWHRYCWENRANRTVTRRWS